MFFVACLVCPRRVDPWQCTSEKGEESSGRKLPALTPVPDGVEFGRRGEVVNTIPGRRIADSQTEVGPSVIDQILRLY